MITHAFNGKTPRVAASALIADNVVVIGDVEIGEECSIWPGVVIRSDTTPIRIGSSRVHACGVRPAPRRGSSPWAATAC